MQREDFNLADAYHIFQGKMDAAGVKEGLDAIGIYPS
jgi:hypothetical protein